MTNNMKISALDVDNMIRVTKRLTELIQTESRLLTEKRPRDADAIREEQVALAGTYTRMLSALKQNPALIRTSNPEKVAILKKATIEFNRAVAKHTNLVARLKRVTEGLVQTIADAASKKARPVIGYGGNAMSRNLNTGTPPAIAVNVNA